MSTDSRPAGKPAENTRAENERVVAACLASGGDILLELGAGGRKRQGWTSIDLGNADIVMDLESAPLPFPDGSVHYIYSSHVFEHFTYPEPMLGILAECFRSLKPGGVFDLSVPDARPYIEAYCAKSFRYPYPLACLHLPAVETHTNGQIDIINYMAYMGGGHRYMFDEENLPNILRRAGFKGVHLREFSPGMDIPERRFESLYARGVKPL